MKFELLIGYISGKKKYCIVNNDSKYKFHRDLSLAYLVDMDLAEFRKVMREQFDGHVHHRYNCLFFTKPNAEKAIEWIESRVVLVKLNGRKIHY